MSDLISRQDAIRLAEQGQIQGFEWQFKKLCELPSAQPKIIRCKDCKWFNKPGCSIWIVDDSDKPSEDDYCSFAELRGDPDAVN